MRKRGMWVGFVNRQRLKRYNRRRGSAVARFFIVTAFAVLYGMPLPLLRLPVQVKHQLCQTVKGTGKTVAEEMLPIRYASKDGNFLSVSKLQGELPAYTMPVQETLKVDVKRVLEERFGNLAEVSFQSFLSNHYIEDSSTKATADIFNINKMLNEDLTIEGTKNITPVPLFGNDLNITDEEILEESFKWIKDKKENHNSCYESTGI